MPYTEEIWASILSEVPCQMQQYFKARFIEGLSKIKAAQSLGLPLREADQMETKIARIMRESPSAGRVQ